MDLFIIRHAWAAERDDSAYPDDSLRPLTEEPQEIRTGASRLSRVVSVGAMTRASE